MILLSFLIVTMLTGMWTDSRPGNIQKAAQTEIEISWKRYLERSQEFNLPFVNDGGANDVAFTRQQYNFQKVDQIESALKGVNRQVMLRRLFQELKRPGQSDEQNWEKLFNHLSEVIRHPYVWQPMYQDGSQVVDPLVLLELGEGRCSHISRLVVDFALANDYESRLVQLAGHQVAEIKWNGNWHFLDADSDFPTLQMHTVFSDWPSIEQIAKTPYLLDKMAARAYRPGLNYTRSLKNQVRPANLDYPGEPLHSSLYFARELFQNYFSPEKPAREGVEYYYKNAGPDDWENDRYYGWMKLRKEISVVPEVEIEYHPELPQLIVPNTVYGDRSFILLPIAFTPACIPHCTSTSERKCNCLPDGFDYEVRISSSSRGWDYDFRNYQRMPLSGNGDLAILKVNDSESKKALIEVKYKITNKKWLSLKQVFIEVVATSPKYRQRGMFFWPSREHRINLFSLSRPQPLL